MELRIKTNEGFYTVHLEKGAIKKAAELFNFDRKVLVVTDSGVPKEYYNTVCSQIKDCFLYILPQGESSKSPENLLKLSEVLINNNFTRTDCIVAVGGGMVGDIAGFLSAVYMRGIDFYNIPTTLLSQVDSSVGGKTAVNFCGYKNILGSFYPPKGVIIDTETLSTLPERQISNGLCEALKMSLTSNKELFGIFKNKNPFCELEKIAELSIRIKKSVVEKDEKEKGLRKILNFGHTLAHAVETNCGGALLHGECVALGMIPMCSPEVKKELLPILKKLNLPTKAEYDIHAVTEALKHDKKSEGDTISVVFVKEIGSYEIKSITFRELEKLIKEEA